MFYHFRQRIVERLTCECLSHCQFVVIRDRPVLIVTDAGDHMVVGNVAGIVTRLVDANVVIPNQSESIVINQSEAYCWTVRFCSWYS